MRFYFIIFITILSQNIFAQPEANSDEQKVFKVVEDMPRFPGCEVGIMTLEERKLCAEKSMLQFIYSNITYPDSARENSIEGKVVLQFTVEKNGQVTDTKLIKDIGYGCGEEALRVVNIMRDQNILWKPGMQKGEPVSVQYTLPVSFKLQDYTPPPPYTIYNGDSIYLQVDKAIEFTQGEDALKRFLAIETGYPESGLDSCLSGAMKSNLVVKKDGSVQLLETVDFSNLGTDFLFEVIKVVPKLENKWTPATYEGNPVNSITTIRIEFRPTSEGCKTNVTKFETALQKVEEGVALHDAEKSEEGLVKMNEALAEYPNNTEWLYFRGIMNLTLKNNEIACEDFQKIREILGIAWYEKWIDVICGN